MTDEPRGPSTETPARRRGRRPATDAESLRTRLGIMLDESRANEQLISLGRLAVCLSTVAFTVGMGVGGRGELTASEAILTACCGIAAAYSLLMLALLRDQRYVGRMGYLSATVDVTLISSGLVGLVVGGLPRLAVDNPLSTPLYLLAVAAAGLRYSRRLTVVTCALAIGQYAVTVVVAARLTPIDWDMQIARMLLIACGGAIAAFSVKRARELRTAAVLDALTGLYNRGFLEERLRLEYERAARYGRELSVAMFDLDRFKQFNDSFGHTAGDLALQETARVLRDGLRSTDTVARYGGEEFVALLPETGKQQALSLLERLRQAFGAHDFGGDESHPGLTVSVGVATFPDDADSLEALRQHADRAVYAAKAAGRDCVRG